VLLLVVYLSYRQTIAAYPSGGGSYIVARQNLGTFAGLLAASALCRKLTRAPSGTSTRIDPCAVRRAALFTTRPSAFQEVHVSLQVVLPHESVSPLRRSSGLLTSAWPASAAAFSISELASPPMRIAAPVKYNHSRRTAAGFSGP
jgi:amino acid transporter